MKTSIRSIVAAASLLALPVFPVGADGEMPGEGITVRPVTAPSVEEQFQHRILYRALEDLGYTIAEPEEVEYQTIHLALGTGDGDFTAVHWNKLHDGFYQESGGDEVLEKVGTLISGALQGYLVNKSAYDDGITDLSDLKDPEKAKLFDADGDGLADLAGCVPGWGCERVIEHELTEYGLRDTVSHNQGAYNAIIADTIARNAAGENVLYYTWTPYWVSGAMVPGEDVEWLSVPYTSLPDGETADTEFEGKNLGFAVDSIRVVGSRDFFEANPAAKAVFEQATIDINDISSQNKLVADGEDSDDDIDAHVSKWIEDHQADYDTWIEAGMAAGVSK